MKKSDNKQLKIQKIPLFALIKILDDLYDQGIEYIDIMADTSQDRDTIKIGVKEEYMMLEEGDDDDDIEFEEEYEDNDDVEDATTPIAKKRLTDEDIINLL